MLVSISPNLIEIIALKNVLVCGDYWIFAARCGEYSALSMLQPRACQTGLFSQFLLQVAVVLEGKQAEG